MAHYGEICGEILKLMQVDAHGEFVDVGRAGPCGRPVPSKWLARGERSGAANSGALAGRGPKPETRTS